MTSMSRRLAAPMLLSALCFAPAAQAKIIFDFDYSFEPANGFFVQNPAAKTVLERAGLVFSDRILDTFTPITPTGSDSWDAQFTNPSTNAGAQVHNLSVPANTLKVYVGARANLGGALGEAGPGGYYVSDLSSFALTTAVTTRGQSNAVGDGSTDIGIWGGTVAFGTSVNWNFNLAAPAAGKNDFLTVATHELAHILGFGTWPSWQTQVIGTNFIGPKTVALYGGPVPLSGSPDHFQFNVASTFGGRAQETLMDPDITVGTRKYVTLLDWAVLDDTGWDLAMPGDADANGTVAFADLLTLATNYGKSSDYRWALGDFNYSGTVDFADLLALAKNYGHSGVQPSSLPESDSPAFAADWATAQAMAAGVPEPSTAALLGLLALPAMLRRRRA